MKHVKLHYYRQWVTKGVEGSDKLEEKNNAYRTNKLFSTQIGEATLADDVLEVLKFKIK